MASQAQKNRRNRWDDLVRFLCFLALSTAGMGAIALALLAEPLTRHYGDREFIRAQQRQIEQLQKLHQQQEELLANADNPSVVERAAVSNFNYVPVPEQDGSTVALPREWPDLKEALAQVDRIPIAKPIPLWRELAEKLAGQPYQQMLLMALGGALVVIALACFYRLR